MAVTLPIADPILASLATLGPGNMNNEAGTGLYQQNTLEPNLNDLHHVGAYSRGRPQRKDKVFWLEFDVLPRKRPQPLPGTPTAFWQFGQLPTEIRILIWEMVAAEGRIITATCRSATRRQVWSLPGRPAQYAYDPAPPPRRSAPALMLSLLQVNHEAYNVARRRYERAFSWRVPYSLDDTSLPPVWVTQDNNNTAGFYDHPPVPPPRLGGRGCLFDYDNDMLLLQGEIEPYDDAASTSIVYFLNKDDTRRVRHVACLADDLGVGHLLPGQLFARLFPIVDRFAIDHQLIVVTPPKFVLPALAHMATTPQQGFEHDDKNICQRVWNQWTNSQNMPHLHSEDGFGGFGGLGLDDVEDLDELEDSDSEEDMEDIGGMDPMFAGHMSQLGPINRNQVLDSTAFFDNAYLHAHGNHAEVRYDDPPAAPEQQASASEQPARATGQTLPSLTQPVSADQLVPLVPANGGMLATLFYTPMVPQYEMEKPNQSQIRITTVPLDRLHEFLATQ